VVALACCTADAPLDTQWPSRGQDCKPRCIGPAPFPAAARRRSQNGRFPSGLFCSADRFASGNTGRSENGRARQKVNDVAGFGLLISAQAWHWIAPDVRYTQARSILRRRGGLAVFCSRPLWEESPVGEALAAVYASRAPQLHGLGPWFPGFAPERLRPGIAMTFRPGAWLPQGQRTEIDASGLFTAVVERSYRWTTEPNRDASH
jgi:hypothetical protein